MVLSHSESETLGIPKMVNNSVQFSRVQLFATPWIAARQASLSITIFRSSLRLTFIESVMPSSHLILCRPLLLLPPIPHSIRVFSYQSTLRMRWPKYWSFSFSIIPSKEIPGLISFRTDWLDLLAVQGTLKSLLQHHRSKASILRRSAFFTVQLSHPYMTTGKIIALTRRTLVDKLMPLLFNMLSRLVITFLPRSKIISIILTSLFLYVLWNRPGAKRRFNRKSWPTWRNQTRSLWGRNTWDWQGGKWKSSVSREKSLSALTQKGIYWTENQPVWLQRGNEDGIMPSIGWFLQGL